MTKIKNIKFLKFLKFPKFPKFAKRGIMKKKNEDNQFSLKTGALVAKFGVSHQTISTWVKVGIIPPEMVRKPNGKYYFSAQVIDHLNSKENITKQ